MKRLNVKAAALVLAGICLSPIGAATAQSAPGYSMTMMTTFELDTGGAKQMEMKTQGTKDRFRIDFGGNFMQAATTGMYMVFDMSGSTMTTVMPTMSMATITDMSSITGAGKIMKAEIKGEPTLQVEDRGAGEPILGFATHRYHVKSEMTTVFSTSSGSCEQTATTESDVWKTTAVDVPPSLTDALISISGKAGTGLTKLEDMKRAKMPGFTIRETSRISTQAGSGPAKLSSGTSELTAFSKGEVDNSRFAVPDGFQSMDMRQLMADMDPATMQDAMAAGAETALKTMCGAVVKSP